MNSNYKKYDKNCRVIKHFEYIVDILYEYKYIKNKRIITITCPGNRTNFRTTIYQIQNEQGEYVNVKKDEHGDIYLISTTYDTNGKEKRYEKINKIKKTNYVKENFTNKDDEYSLWIVNYNGKQSIGFKSNIKKLKTNKNVRKNKK